LSVVVHKERRKRETARVNRWSARRCCQHLSTNARTCYSSGMLRILPWRDDNCSEIILLSSKSSGNFWHVCHKDEVLSTSLSRHTKSYIRCQLPLT